MLWTLLAIAGLVGGGFFGRGYFDRWRFSRQAKNSRVEIAQNTVGMWEWRVQSDARGTVAQGGRTFEKRHQAIINFGLAKAAMNGASV